MVSRTFKIAVKLHPQPAYRLAQAAGIDGTTLSKLMNGIVKVQPNDPRVLAVGRILGMKPGECFTGGR